MVYAGSDLDVGQLTGFMRELFRAREELRGDDTVPLARSVTPIQEDVTVEPESNAGTILEPSTPEQQQTTNNQSNTNPKAESPPPPPQKNPNQKKTRTTLLTTPQLHFSDNSVPRNTTAKTFNLHYSKIKNNASVTS